MAFAYCYKLLLAMENFATANQERLIEELKGYKLQEQKQLDSKIGIVRQFIRDNIEGIDKAIEIVQKSLDELRAM